MKNIEVIKYSTDEKHTKLLNFMRAWAKRKQDRQEQVWKDYEEGKYDETIKKLREKKEMRTLTTALYRVKPCQL